MTKKVVELLKQRHFRNNEGPLEQKRYTLNGLLQPRFIVDEKLSKGNLTYYKEGV